MKIKIIIIMFSILFYGLNYLNINAIRFPERRENNSIYYEYQGHDKSLGDGINMVRNTTDTNTDKKASEYIQDIVNYLLTFVTLIGVIIIIYSGFKILTSAGDDEANKTSKKIIISVIIGMIVMYASSAIIVFILDMLGPIIDSDSTD